MQGCRHSTWLKILGIVTAGALMLGMGTHAAAQTVRVGGTGSGLGTARVMADTFTKGAQQITLTIVPNLGSSGALRALQAGAIDAAIIARPLRPAETANGLVGYEYGRSPFVFVSSKPDVKNLTAATIADVLSGRATRWPDGQPVRFVLRPQSDGDSALLASFSPEIESALKLAHTRPGMVLAPTDQEAADEAERLPGSLAANTLALVLSKRRKLNVIPFSGVAPSVKTLASGAYPYYKSLVIVTRGAPEGAVLKLIEFYQSPKGRAILEANGHFVAR